jgi:hypothetical protein
MKTLTLEHHVKIDIAPEGRAGTREWDQQNSPETDGSQRDLSAWRGVVPPASMITAGLRTNGPCKRPVAGSRGAYKVREAVLELWPAAAALGRGRGNTSNSFQDTQSIPLQLHLYTIFKNLCLRKYIKSGTSFMACGTKNSLTTYFPEGKVKRYYFFHLHCKFSR